MKAAVRVESYNISSFFIVIHKLQLCLLTIAQVGVALSPSYIYIFNHLTFPGFPFILML